MSRLASSLTTLDLEKDIPQPQAKSGSIKLKKKKKKQILGRKEQSRPFQEQKGNHGLLYSSQRPGCTGAPESQSCPQVDEPDYKTQWIHKELQLCHLAISQPAIRLPPGTRMQRLWFKREHNKDLYKVCKLDHFVCFFSIVKHARQH